LNSVVIRDSFLNMCSEPTLNVLPGFRSIPTLSVDVACAYVFYLQGY
jgi:hypothetical protein